MNAATTRARAATVAVVLALLCGALPTIAAGAMPALEGITIGESLAAIRERLGDPVSTTPQADGATMWRFLEGNGGWFLDVLEKDNVAYAVTVLARFDNSKHVASNGVIFGMTSAQLRSKLGNPNNVERDADGTVSFWYREGASLWIYELRSDRLGYVQLALFHGLDAALPAGPPVNLGDGSSLDRAIRPVQDSMLAGAVWPDVYLGLHACGTNGHWVTDRYEHVASPENVTYHLVHAVCSDASVKRDFYFDTRGCMLKTSSDPLYVEVPAHALRSPAPSAPLRSRLP